MDSGIASLLVAAGSAAIAVASLLWALRVTDGARGGVEAWKRRARELEDKVAWADGKIDAKEHTIILDLARTEPAGAAVAAINAGRFKDEICPVAIPQRKGDPLIFDTDEGPRADSTLPTSR